MKSKKYIKIIVPTIFVFWHLAGYSSEDLLIKNFGDWPVVKIDNSNRIHLIITKAIGSGPLGYYQYDINNRVFIDSIPVLDSSTHAAQFLKCAINKDNVLISYEENYPNIYAFLLIAQNIDLKEMKQSRPLPIKEFASGVGMSGNIAFNDSMFCVVWVSFDDDAIFGQFITSLTALEGSDFQISDSIGYCRVTPAGVDYNPINRHFITIWSDDHSGDYRLYGRVFSRDRSTWGATLELSDSLKIVNAAIWYPQVFWGTDTSFIVFFRNDDGNLYYRSFNLIGEALTSKRMVNNLPGSVDDFTCVRDNLGRTVAVWEDKASGKILCQRFNTDASLLDTVFAVSSGVYQVPSFSLSADFRDGKVAIVWNDADYKIWLKVFDFENPVEIEPEKVEVKPQEFRLVTNYPNPFNAATHVRFYLPQAGQVSLKVWDLRGVLVREIETQIMPAGWQAIGFEADNLPSGIYIYELKSGREHGLGKMVLLR